jgi:hypothetical protein
MLSFTLNFDTHTHRNILTDHQRLIRNGKYTAIKNISTLCLFVA